MLCLYQRSEVLQKWRAKLLIPVSGKQVQKEAEAQNRQLRHIRDT